MKHIKDVLKSKFEGYKHTMETICIPFFYKKSLHNTLFILLLIAIATLIFMLNHLSAPWVADDFCKGQLVLSFNSFSDWFNHIYNFYFSWGGRIWAELFALVSLAMPKSLYNILNTLVYMAVVLLIYFNILGKRKVSVSLFLGINFSLWAFLPTFGQDILWITGSANYLWTSLIFLSSLTCWRLYYEKPYPIFSNPVVVIAVAIISLFAGWMNENVSIAILFLQICFAMFYKIRDKKIPAFATLGTISTFVGMMFLNLAPGNFARFAFEQHSVSIGNFTENIFRNILVFMEFEKGLPLLILLVGGGVKAKAKNKLLAYSYALTALVACLAFSVVDHIGGRVMFAPLIFLIISVCILYKDKFTDIKGKELRIIATFMLLVAIHSFFSDARTAIEDYSKQYEENVRIIEVSKAKGNLDVIVKPNVAKNKFCAAYGLDDIKRSDEIHHWVNDGVARYFKIRTIHSAHISE